MLSVGTRIITTEENGFTEAGRRGTIKAVDETDEMMPYKVLLDGEAYAEWVYAEEIKEDKQ